MPPSASNQLVQKNQALSHIIVNLNQTTTHLAREKKQLESLLDNITEAVIATNIQGKILHFNPAASRLTGLPEVQTLNRHCDDILHLLNEGKTLTFKTYCPTHSQKPQKYHQKNLGLISQSQQLIPVDLSSSPIITLQGHTGWVITLHDLTQEQELEQMKQDFVSIAAHQLRTPLTTILGYLEAIQEEQLSPAQKTFLRHITHSAHQLQALIENLLNVTRIEKGTIQVNFQPTNLAQLVKNVTRDLAYQIDSKQHHLVLHLPNHLPRIPLDPLHIRQVVANLLTNAIRYTPPKGTITASVKRQSNYLVTSITDTGPGIPRPAIKHLFTKFYHAPHTPQSSESTGLGLYLAKELVKLHHGRIRVNSQPGQGSTFSFSLPLKQPISKSKKK